MAESYFELLTEQQGIPAKPFNPVEELKRLRRELALRTRTFELTAEKITDPCPVQTNIVQTETEIDAKDAVLLPTRKTAPSETEPASLESITKKADDMKRTLAIWQRSRKRTKPVRSDIFRGNVFQKSRKSRNKRNNSSLIIRFLTTPQEKTLQTVNAGLIALGIVGVIFGVLSFFRGLESDLSIGTLVCVTGATVVAIGLGGRLLAARNDFLRI